MARHTQIVFALALWIALGSSCRTTDDTTDASAFDTWHDGMEHLIGPTYDELLLPEATREPGAMDFRRIERGARRAAAFMALGHGRFEQRDVVDFARYAREAEAWLNDIAEHAARRDGVRVQELIRDGAVRHCDRCHDASG